MRPPRFLSLVTVAFTLVSPLAAARAAVTASADAASVKSEYAAPELLVETVWLAAHGKDAGVRVVDMRTAEAFATGHVPGAVFLSDGPLRNGEDRHTYLPKPEALAALLGGLGISNATHVVIYDNFGGRQSARLWYVLNAYGHTRVSLVNGGWDAWVAEKRPVTQDTLRVEPALFEPKLTPALSCPSPEVLARKPGVVVLDTRSEREFQASRIPGAVNVDWADNISGPEKRFKSATALKQMYAAKGVTPDKEIISHCASGGRAAQSLFTLKLLGYPKVRVYYGSFSDYTSRPESPVEK